jgi:hypothetical protein
MTGANCEGGRDFGRVFEASTYIKYFLAAHGNARDGFGETPEERGMSAILSPETLAHAMRTGGVSRGASYASSWSAVLPGQ